MTTIRSKAARAPWVVAGLMIASSFGVLAAENVDAAAHWQTVLPGGDSLCSDGSDYRFFVRRGATDKVLFHLQGGGGCWNRATCDREMMGTYSHTTEGVQPPTAGVFDTQDDRNPLRDHTVVFVTYCSGDVHLGARDAVYEPVQEGQTPLTIYHRGRANVEAALGWMRNQLPAPASIVVTGSSAGAIPSPYYASILADQYPDARIVQFGDAAGGYRQDTPIDMPEKAWGTFSFIQQTPGFESLDASTFNYEQLYIAAAKANPSVQFSRYDTAVDGAQIYFLKLRGIEQPDLEQALHDGAEEIGSAVSNVKHYVAAGAEHTILGREEFYSVRVGDESLRDWLSALVQFEALDDVFCDPCEVPTAAQ